MNHKKVPDNITEIMSKTDEKRQILNRHKHRKKKRGIRKRNDGYKSMIELKQEKEKETQEKKKRQIVNRGRRCNNQHGKEIETP